jgi:hypothetical protein
MRRGFTGTARVHARSAAASEKHEDAPNTPLIPAQAGTQAFSPSAFGVEAKGGFPPEADLARSTDNRQTQLQGKGGVHQMAGSKDMTGGVSRWWGVPPAMVGVLVGWLVSRAAPMAMAEASGISVGVFLIMMVVYWRRRLERWFWPFMISIGLAHVVAILFVPWPPNHDLTKGDLMFVWLDAIPYLGVAVLTAQLSAGKPKGS